MTTDINHNPHLALLARTIAKDIVQQLAPEELEVFDELTSPDSGWGSPTTSSEHPDDPLAFGLGEIIQPWAPVVHSVVGAAIVFVFKDLGLDIVKDVVKDSVKEKINDWLKAKTSSAAGTSAPALTGDQLTQLEQFLLSEAKRLGLKQAKARALSLATVRAMAIPRVER